MRLRLLLMPLIAAAALVAGCTATSPTAQTTPTPTTNGYEDKSADEIMKAAQDALDAAKSYHIKADGMSDGQKIAMDLTFAGKNAQGTVTMLNMDLQVLKIGSDVYVKGPDALWSLLGIDSTKLAKMKTAIQDKWVRLPSSLAKDFPIPDGNIKPEGTLSKGDVITTADGTKAIVLKDSAGGELHVSLVGKPYPLELVDSQSNTYTLSDFDKDVTVAAPAAADAVDLAVAMAAAY